MRLKKYFSKRTKFGVFLKKKLDFLSKPVKVANLLWNAGQMMLIHKDVFYPPDLQVFFAAFRKTLNFKFGKMVFFEKTLSSS